MAFEDIETKDIILATLAELENDIIETSTYNTDESIKKSVTIDIQDGIANHYKDSDPQQPKQDSIKKWKDEESLAQKSSDKIKEIELVKTLNKLEDNTDDELKFLSGMRERLLVLFEGLNTSSNQRLEKKLSITMSYLEYTLAVIEERLELKD